MLQAAHRIARIARHLRRGWRTLPALFRQSRARLTRRNWRPSIVKFVVVNVVHLAVAMYLVENLVSEKTETVKIFRDLDSLDLPMLCRSEGISPDTSTVDYDTNMEAVSGGEFENIDKMADKILINEDPFNGTMNESLMEPELPDRNPLTGYGSQDFKHPLLVDMPDLLQRVRAGRPAPVRAINRLEAPWLIGQTGSCATESPVYLVLLVKSQPSNYANREAIRATWGRPDCWRRSVRIFFLLGADAAHGIRRGSRVLRQVHNWRTALLWENASRGDLLVREFVDHYYNNTLKLMSGVQWSARECSRAQFTAFVDDDFFVNPDQVERELDSLSPAVYARFLGGWVWRTSRPKRSNWRQKSKWDISVSEYPWSTYPPYVAGGALFMSGPVIQDISVAMEYTQYLRFDDIFIGLVAHKLLLTPLHMEMVRASDPVLANSTDTDTLMRLIASHGFKQPGDIMLLWQRLNLFSLCSNRKQKPGERK